MKRVVFAALAWLALCAPSYAVISAPTDLGGCTNTSSVTSCSITTNANTVPSGATIFVVYMVGNWSAPSFSDGTNGAYTQFCDFLYSSTHHQGVFYHKNVSGLASGSTITISWTTGAAVSVEAFYVTGLDTSAPADQCGTGQTGSSTGTTAPVTTSTLTNSNEIGFAFATLGNTAGTVTAPTSPWNSMTVPAQGVNTTVLLYDDIVAVNTGLSTNITWTNSRLYGAQIFTFQAPSGATATPAALLTGVGP